MKVELSEPEMNVILDALFAVDEIQGMMLLRRLSDELPEEFPDDYFIKEFKFRNLHINNEQEAAWISTTDKLNKALGIS